jgi:hypothetical protein
MTGNVVKFPYKASHRVYSRAARSAAPQLNSVTTVKSSRRTDSEAIERPCTVRRKATWPLDYRAKKREFCDSIRRRIKALAKSRDLSAEDIKPAMTTKHFHLVQFAERHDINIEWLITDEWQRARTKTRRIANKILKIKPKTMVGMLVRIRVIETLGEDLPYDPAKKLVAEIRDFAKRTDARDRLA